MEIAVENILHVKVKKLKSTLDEEFALCGAIYQTEENKFYFVKKDTKVKDSYKSFEGELEGLKAIHDTNTLMTPNPITTGRTKNGQNFILMDFMNMTVIDAKTAAELGSQLADMHLCNLNEKCGKRPAVKKFGFHVPTGIDFILQNNSWTDDWITFFVENRLSYQVHLLEISREYNLEREMVVESYWPELKPHIPKFFKGIDVKPSLLHGNLWIENAAQFNSKPVVFDPSAFYGHHEFDIAGAIHFNESFIKDFRDAYHKKIPKAAGIENRMLLYQLYHELNHWNYFGGSYAAINSLLDLLKICKKKLV